MNLPLPSQRTVYAALIAVCAVLLDAQPANAAGAEHDPGDDPRKKIFNYVQIPWPLA